MLTFFKRERALFMLPWCALFTALMLVPLTGFSDGPLAGSSSLEAATHYGFGAIVSLQAVLVFAGRHLSIRTRVRESERALPVTMRRVVLERLAAIWVTFFGVFFAGSLVWLASAARGAEITGYGWGVARAFAASGVSVLLLGCYRPAQPLLSMREAILLSAASCAVWISSMYFIESIPNAVYFAALLIQLVFLMVAVPAASPAIDPKVAVGAASASAEGSSRAGADLPVRLFGALNWTILRSTVLRVPVLAILAVLVGYLWFGQGMVLMAGIFVILLPFMALRMGLNVLQGIDALPIRRERVLRLASLSALGALSLCMIGASRSRGQYMGYEILSRSVEVDSCFEEAWGEEKEYRVHVKVPPELWRMGGTPAAAVVTAPWGESVEPTLHPIHPGAETFTYNPYDVRPGNSVRFLTWQVTRAIEVVHGTTGRTDEHLADWLGTLDREEAIGDARIRDLNSADWMVPAPGGLKSPNARGFAALLAVLIWLLATGYLLLPNTPPKNRPGWLEKLPNGAGATVLMVLIGGALVLTEINDRSLMPVLGAQLHAWIDARLGSSPALWAALVASLTATGYALLAWRIQRIEVPPLAVHGWTKKPMSIY